MVMIALVLHVQENLGLGARDVTPFAHPLATGIVGGIAGGLVAERGIARIGLCAATRWATLASAVSFAVLCAAPNAAVLAAVLVFLELTSVFWNVVSPSYRQRAIPDEILGRVNGIYRLLSWGMMSVRLVLSGLVVRGAEALVPRDVAVLAPFTLASAATSFLTAAVWRPLQTGFGGGPRVRP